MTDLPAPLTPPDCDLTDFDRMHIDIKVLRRSKFDAGLDDTAWRAGVNLWMSAWHGSPAASLDDDDEALTVAAGLRDLKKWARVKAKALRGWIKCSDGRLYHATVSEFALEAWLEKLSQRKSSGAGNAKRWGAKFDPEQVQADIDTACEYLARLNPDSRAIVKARRKNGKRNPEGNPDGTDKPHETESRRDKSPRGESSLGKGREEKGSNIDTPLPPESGPPAGANAGGGPAALSAKAWFDRVDALIADLPGVNRTTTGLANVAPLRALCEPTDGDPPCDWGLDVDPAIRAVAASCAAGRTGLRSWTHPAIADTARANRDRRLAPQEQTHGHQQAAQLGRTRSPGPQLGGLRRAALQDQARRAAESGQRPDDADGDRDQLGA